MAEACTCTIRNHGRVIEFCPMHKAAPEMLAALKGVASCAIQLRGEPVFAKQGRDDLDRERGKLDQAVAAIGLAQAKPQEAK